MLAPTQVFDGTFCGRSYPRLAAFLSSHGLLARVICQFPAELSEAG